jgi:hypothetical protein
MFFDALFFNYLSLYLQGGLEPIMPVDRKWMYKTPRLALAFFENVTEFIVTAKRHCLREKKDLIICSRKSCKNNYA